MVSTLRRRSPQTASVWVRRARPVLGTLVAISVADRRPTRQLHAAIDLAFGCMERIHRLMSFQMPGSELQRLNREAARHPQIVDPHTYAVFETALRIAALSDGAFDPCVAPRLEEWGLLPHGESPCEPAANWRAIELLSGERIRYASPVRTDLGGIAKGYAVDLAVQSLQANGLEHIIVNAGGDLRVAGPNVHCVRLRSPSQPSRSRHALVLCGAALATSANYFSRRASSAARVSALVNPRDGTPYLGARSVSVRATDCMVADALTKVVLFAPSEIAETTLASFDAQAYVI
jgi:FAD:protein FMN transferase